MRYLVVAACAVLLLMQQPARQGITVTPSQASVMVGASMQLTASVNGSSWSSSNPAVASVDAAGRVTGRAAGTATITAKYRSQRGMSTVVVMAKPPDLPPPDPESVYGPSPTIVCPQEAAVLGTHDDIQTAITGSGEGASFCLAAGVHILSAPVLVKAGMTFTCSYGGVLSGTGVARRVFDASADNITLRNCVVEQFTNPAQAGAVDAGTRSGWLITNNETRFNGGYGIRIGPGSRVLHNYAHHNGQLGIGGCCSNDVLIEDNEIAYNNTAGYDPGWEAGGTKFTNTNRLTVRKNFVHHNAGQGLWTDINTINTLYEGNTVEDNDRIGIFHEISYAAVIRNNVVRRNGFGFTPWIWGAGILIAASSDVEVYGNVVEANADGIGAAQQNRGSGTYGAYEVRNLYVHDNLVTMTSGWTGLVQDIGDTSYFTSKNNRFVANTYDLSAASALPFTWDNKELSYAQWLEYGLK